MTSGIACKARSQSTPGLYYRSFTVVRLAYGPCPTNRRCAHHESPQSDRRAALATTSEQPRRAARRPSPTWAEAGRSVQLCLPAVRLAGLSSTPMVPDEDGPVETGPEVQMLAALLRNTGLKTDVVNANVLVGLPAPHPLAGHSYQVICAHPVDCGCAAGQVAP